MRRRRTFLAWAFIAVAAGLPLASAPACAQAPPTPDLLVDQIAECLHGGKEVVMARGFECVPRSTGADIARKAGMPFALADAKAVCEGAADPRQLSGDVIKRLVAHKDKPAASGIRIIGAIFCGEVDLVGLDLPYSLVLDRASFAARVFARNFKMRGDLSLDSSFLPYSLILTRSQMTGSFYAEDSLINRVVVYDTQIQGSWHQDNAIILKDVEFHGLAISGDVDFSDSALSRLAISSGQIGSGLILNRSEARCAYHIRSSMIGYVLAEQAGFGALVRPEQRAQGPAYAWWDRLAADTKLRTNEVDTFRPIGQRLKSAAATAIVDNEVKRSLAETKNVVRGCEDTSASSYAEFYFFNSRVQSNFCLRGFGWLRPDASGGNPSGHPTTILALNGSNVSNSLIVDLWSNAPTRAGPDLLGQWYDGGNRELAVKRKFEAIGVSMGSLVYNFDGLDHPYVTYLDGLKFAQVYKAAANCDLRLSGADGNRRRRASDLSVDGTTVEQRSLPTADDVMSWLDRNTASSSQPIAAFVPAFEQAGADASELRIKWKTTDLCAKSPPWMGAFRFMPCWRAGRDGAASDDHGSPGIGPAQASTAGAASPGEAVAGIGPNLIAAIFDAFAKVFLVIANLVTLTFQWTLWAVADHGIRPGKVVWWVGGVLLVFWELIWRYLGIVAYQPKTKDEQPAGQTPVLWPINMLFLFDRLIPLYKIRDEHYSIAKVYRRATDAEVQQRPPAPDAPPYEMYYLRQKYFVCPAADAELRRLEKWLVVLRIIGAALTIFLLAAISALTK